MLPLRRLLRESLDLADLLALAERCPRSAGRTAVVALLRGAAVLGAGARPGHARRCSPRPRTRRRDADPAVRADVLVQLVLAREQFGLRAGPRPGRRPGARAAESGDPALLVRATALRAHPARPGRRRCSTGAVELAARQAPGLLLWARAAGCTCGTGDRPEQARADVEQPAAGDCPWSARARAPPAC